MIEDTGVDRDVIAQQLFEAYATGNTQAERFAAISAATTSWAVAITLVDAIIGLLLMRIAMPRLESAGSGSVATGSNTEPTEI